MPGQKKIIEISAYTAEWAISAARAGAGRIELCDNISEGGTTPSYGMMRQVITKLKIPVLPLIRPRGGNFCYTDTEFESIRDDIQMAKNAGAHGIVTGILKPSGEIDIERNREIVDLARPMEVAFHRAFDITPDPVKALEDLISIGYDRVLTAGQVLNAENGIGLIARLVQLAGKRISIMPGGGINAFNIGLIARKTGTNEFHLSARKVNWEEAINYSGDICFCTPGTRLFTIDVQKVRDVREQLEKL